LRNKLLKIQVKNLEQQVIINNQDFKLQLHIMKFIISLSIILSSLLSTVLCQPAALLASDGNLVSELSLDECIEIGNQHNLALQSSRLDYEIDKPALRAAYGQFLPSISVGYSIDQSSFLNRTFLNPDGSVAVLPISIDGKRRNSNYFLRANETFYDGGRNYYNLQNAKLESKLRYHRVNSQYYNFRAEVTRAYCQTIAAMQKVDLANEVLVQRYRLLELASIRFKTGSVTRRDVMQAEVNLGRGRNDSLSAALELKSSKIDLNLITGRELDTTIIVKPLPPLFKPNWSVTDLISNALQTRSNLLSNITTNEMNNNDVSALKGEYLPTLTGSISHSRTEQSGTSESFTLKPRNRSTGYGLSLSWLAFDRFTRSLRIQEAKIRHQKTSIQQFVIERQIRQQILSTFDNIESIFQLSIVANQNTDLALETNRFEEERYRLGSATTIDLGAAQVSYIQARNDQIRLETEFYIALGELEKATGIILRTKY